MPDRSPYQPKELPALHRVERDQTERRSRFEIMTLRIRELEQRIEALEHAERKRETND